jgi:MshEN domain
VEDVVLSGVYAALREEEHFSLICIYAFEDSEASLARAAPRIRRNVRQGDTVLLAERACAIILSETTLESAQALARRLVVLLADVECELELLHGLAARELVERMQAARAVEIQYEEERSPAFLPEVEQAALPGVSLPYLAFLADYPPRRLFRLFPYDLACQYQCFPVGAERDMLTVGTRERLDEQVIEHFRQVTKRGIFQVRCEARLIDDVLRYWQRLYEVEAMFN